MNKQATKELKSVKVNYIKLYGCEGRVINQTITIGTEAIKEFNKYIKYRKDNNYINGRIINQNIYFYADPIGEGARWEDIKLTQLNLLKEFLTKNNIDIKRIKTDRNTRLNIYRVINPEEE